MVSFPFIDKQRSQNPPDFFNRNSEKQRRLEGYKRAWEAYLAELPDPVKIENGVNDNVKSNPLRAIVEVGVYFLFGDEVRFELKKTRKGQSKADLTPSKKPDPKLDAKTEDPDKAAPAKPTEGKAPEDKPKASVGKGPNDHEIGDPVHAVLENNPAILEDPPYVADLDKIWKANRKKAFLN